MNAERSARWVRRWVALYTRGLPADARRDRGDEIESDLWCHMAEASDGVEGVGAIGNEILARLMLGIPADIRWRFEQTSGARPVPVSGSQRNLPETSPISAMIGGIAWALWCVPAVFLGDAAWVGMPGVLTMISLLVGAFCLSFGTAGLVFGNIDRLHGIVSMLGAIGAGVGLLLAGGVYLGLWCCRLDRRRSCGISRGWASSGRGSPGSTLDPVSSMRRAPCCCLATSSHQGPRAPSCT